MKWQQNLGRSKNYEKYFIVQKYLEGKNTKTNVFKHVMSAKNTLIIDMVFIILSMCRYLFFLLLVLYLFMSPFFDLRFYIDTMASDI